ncbi:MAG: flagellar biosynthesis protein FlhB [Peptococcaceae bacterium]
MVDQQAQEKTEKATPRKIQEARRLGQVAKSADLNSALILLFIAFFLLITKDFYLNRLGRFLAGFFEHFLSAKASELDLLSIFQGTIFQAFFLFLPFLIIPIVIALGANLLQVGFLFAPGVLVPKGERLNPVSGLQRIFSLRGLVELIKTIFKIIVAGGTTYLLIKNQLPSLIKIFHCSAAGSALVIVNFGTHILLYGALAYLILAIADYLYQRYEHQKSIRMTKQEMKEELRQTEGDPLVKAQIRRRQRSLALNRIQQEVPRATVVITNPVHLAIALQYVEQEMEAPKVTAKGAGELAGQIKKIAQENNVPIVEHKELARFLYYQVEVTEEIPVVLYQMVAEILAHIYRLKKKV